MNRETKRLRRSDPRARLFVHEATQPSADEVVKHSWALVVKSVSLPCGCTQRSPEVHKALKAGRTQPRSRCGLGPERRSTGICETGKERSGVLTYSSVASTAASPWGIGRGSTPPIFLAAPFCMLPPRTGDGESAVAPFGTNRRGDPKSPACLTGSPPVPGYGIRPDNDV